MVTHAIVIASKYEEYERKNEKFKVKPETKKRSREYNYGKCWQK